MSAQDLADPVADFLRAACVPREFEGASSHASGTLERAQGILTVHPEVAGASVHTAAVLGDDAGVQRFLAQDPGNASAKGGPWGWDALTHLCFSRFLRLDRGRSEAFVRAARALLDAGADPNTGFFEEEHQPRPEWESAIYGAAGVAHHLELTRLLLERGADPNDEETPYHAAEGYDNEALYALVESGKLTADNLGTILLRKTDWHDLDAIRWLLERGVDPKRLTRWGKTALHNALLSDNSLEIVAALLEHGADPLVLATRPDRSPQSSPPRSAVQLAAWRGRGDVLELFEQRGLRIELEGLDALLAACARGDESAARAQAAAAPGLVPELLAHGGNVLARFASVGNEAGVRLLLDLGVPVDAPFELGDGYSGVARRSTSLHVAAWRGRPEIVRLLLERGASVDARDGAGRTPLQLAVAACTDSWWRWRRSPQWLEPLLAAGASLDGVPYPTGYDEADELLRHYGAAAEGAP